MSCELSYTESQDEHWEQAQEYGIKLIRNSCVVLGQTALLIINGEDKLNLNNPKMDDIDAKTK